MVYIHSPTGPDPMLFFETGAMLFTFVSLGRFLEHLAKSKTSAALHDLMALQPQSANLLQTSSSGDLEESTIGIDLLQRGDHIRVGSMAISPLSFSLSYPPLTSPASRRTEGPSARQLHACVFWASGGVQVRAGEKIPADGIVVEGSGQADEAMLTGEAFLLRKQKDDAVIGGTILALGMIVMKVTHAGKDASLARIVALVEKAQMSKAPIQRIAGLLPCTLLGRWVFP